MNSPPVPVPPSPQSYWSQNGEMFLFSGFMFGVYKVFDWGFYKMRLVGVSIM